MPKGGGSGGCASGAVSLSSAPVVRLRSTTRRAGGALLPLLPRCSVLHSMRMVGMKTSGISVEYRPDAHPPAGPKGQGGAEDESEDEVHMQLYCVCRQLYDDRFMLGCEKCAGFCSGPRFWEFKC